jgi:hypothetical protein
MKTKLFNISGKPDALRQNARRFAIIFSVILTLGFASCPTEDDDSTNSNNTDGANSDVIGTWKTSDAQATLEIGNGTWTLYGEMSYNGTWSRQGNTLSLTYANFGEGSFGTATLSSGKLIVIITFVAPRQTYELTKDGSSSGDGTTKLTINNQSFSNLTDVTWNGISFGNINLGYPVTKSVNEGSGYIFFTRATNPIIARTSAALVVEQNGQESFIFTDNTMVVQSDDPTNTGTLGTLAERVTAPAGLTVSPGNGSIHARWQAVTHATEYRVYCGTAQDPPSTPVITVTEPSANITGLTNDILHYVWVKAANSRNESPFSNRASCTPAVPSDDIAWQGNWMQQNAMQCVSPPINHDGSTSETLTIISAAGCSLSVTLTASSESNYDFGYASVLDTNWTTSSYRMRVSGTETQTSIYNIPAGTHTIKFGYKKDSTNSAGTDNITVSVLLQ